MSSQNLPPRPPREHGYAIVRVDTDTGPDTPWEHRVTVTKVVMDVDRAVAEVERLNGLNGVKGCYYFSQITRLMPSVEEAVVEPAEPAAAGRPSHS